MAALDGFPSLIITDSMAAACSGADVFACATSFLAEALARGAVVQGGGLLLADQPATVGVVLACLAFFALLILGGTAAWDARTGRVPDAALAVGAVVVAAGLLLVTPLTFGVLRGVAAVGSWAMLWGINALWYRFGRRDAIGMGDAKWTALAVLAFSGSAALIAWLIGAWLALIWMAGARLFRCRLSRVYFAPFLFGGLILGLVLAPRL